MQASLKFPIYRPGVADAYVPKAIASPPIARPQGPAASPPSAGPCQGFADGFLASADWTDHDD